MSLARKHFTEFKERGGDIADAELDDFWATLQPATIDGMIGEWKGGEFPTGHKMNGSLEKAGWFGKTFKSASDVQAAGLPGRRRQQVLQRRAMGRARPACGWRSSAARSPRRWSTTASPCTTTSRRSTTTP